MTDLTASETTNLDRYGSSKHDSAPPRYFRRVGRLWLWVDRSAGKWLETELGNALVGRLIAETLERPHKVSTCRVGERSLSFPLDVAEPLMEMTHRLVQPRHARPSRVASSGHGSPGSCMQLWPVASRQIYRKRAEVSALQPRGRSKACAGLESHGHRTRPNHERPLTAFPQFRGVSAGGRHCGLNQ